MEQSTKSKKRIFHILVITAIIWLTLIGRLFFIQIMSAKDFSVNHVNLLEKSVQQRKQEFSLSLGRGNIYDRNMQSLLAQKEIETVVVFPFSKDLINTDKIKKLAEVLNMNENELLNEIGGFETPSYLYKGNKPLEITDYQKRLIQELEIPGIVAVSYTLQEEDNVLAKHVIGYLGQAPEVIKESFSDYLNRGILKTDSLIGRSGLQMTFQDLLMGIGDSKIAYYADNKGHPLNGLSSKLLLNEDSYYPLSLITTLDRNIQLIAEKQLEKNNVKNGSIVILDVENADILAMASTPDFELDNVNPVFSNWNNKAVQVTEPGSIFKTVIAIAGLEEGVVQLDEKFYCSGEIEDYHFSCYKPHGEITFAEGYAESCNIVFAETAKRLGSEKIEQYAESLDVVGRVGWAGDFFHSKSFAQIANEEPNRVFHPETNLDDTGSIIRTAIGQQDVRISPLAAANLVVTVLNEGQVFQPRLVKRVIYKNGTDYYQFPVHKVDWRVGYEQTYSEIRKLMERVVEEGTGQLLKQATWNLAGKTGTAETANNLNNQWFIGYGPVGNPKYAMAVAVRDVPADLTAKKVFLGVMDELASLETEILSTH